VKNRFFAGRPALRYVDTDADAGANAARAAPGRARLCVS